ncbi:MAG: dihydropteroate synthase, partial [Thermoleophilaceae bacterium]|nr:dihydropteroate synthase [Thermoleophilaceae bacterium]
GGIDDQVERALAMGADIVDVGGESGVTDRPPVPAAEEAARVVPLVERLVAEGVVVSVDTWKAEVARAALDAGASMINDVSGLVEPDVAAACAESGAALVVMHTRALPKQKAFPGYDDVAADVLAFLSERMAVARDQGVLDEQLVVDPGPDFAKTPAETVAALRRLRDLAELGRPVLLAASRKDFLGALTGRPPAGRLAGTLAAIGEGVDAGAAIVRVHDVAATRDFLTVRSALRGEIEVPQELRLDQRLRRQAGTPA